MHTAPLPVNDLRSAPGLLVGVSAMLHLLTVEEEVAAHSDRLLPVRLSASLRMGSFSSSSSSAVRECRCVR